MGAASVRSAPVGLDASERRILNPRPYRVFRKSYSATEAKVGAVVLLGLTLLAGWVAWRGAHPDPGLFADPATIPTGSVARADVGGRTAPGGSSPMGTSTAVQAGSGPSSGRASTAVDRGALPVSLAATGWSERAISRFDAENLYVKIDGRADFFLSRGFRSLSFVTLDGPSGAAVDVELYDLGSAENALGAFAAEKPAETKAKSDGGTSWYVARNALFLARGGSYARAIGSDESPAVLAQLDALRRAFEGAIAAGEKPWTVALFADALGLPPDRLQYAAENAFSFGFAKNVSSATLDDGETEIFVLPAGDAAKAKTLSSKFEAGFLSYGEKVEAAGVSWVKDRYLSTFSRTVAAGTMVVGVRGAQDMAKGAEALARLEKAVLALPPDVAKKAAAGPASAAKPTGGGYE